jgi:hypothetical protein
MRGVFSYERSGLGREPITRFQLHLFILDLRSQDHAQKVSRLEFGLEFVEVTRDSLATGLVGA